MLTGLDALFASDDLLKRHLLGRRVGVCCNHTAITADLDPILPRLRRAGVQVERVWPSTASTVRRRT